MYTVFESDADIEETVKHGRDLLADLTGRQEQLGERILLEAELMIPTQHKGCECFYVIREGAVGYWKGGSQLFIFEEGDLIGLPAQMPVGGYFKTDFAVWADVYNLASWREVIAKEKDLTDKWNDFLCSQLSLLTILIGTVAPAGSNFAPKLKRYQEGELIISQGSIEHEVFSLVEGHAEVLKDGVCVGEVLQNEIFGALAALTNSRRTAEVRATKPCLVSALPKDHFLELIKKRPTTVRKLVEDMARAIIALNQQVVLLKGKS